MKSLILTVAYLWKDTWNRWFEQPGSPLARGVVVGILATLSAFLLIGFYLQEKTILNKIEALGANTIILKDASSPSSGIISSNKLGRYFYHLKELGQTIQIEMIPGLARDSNNGVVPIITSPDLRTSGQHPFILYTNTLPAGSNTRLSINNNFIDSIVKTPPEWLRSSGFSSLLLIPDTWKSYFGSIGTSEWIIFTDDPDSNPTLEQIAHSIQKIKNSESLHSLQIISPIKLREELNSWQEKARLWKQALLLSLALVISLICGTISILEFRQNLYIYSLMKSFGISNKLLYLRAFIDSFIVANIFSALVIFLVYSLSPWIFTNFGFSQSVTINALSSNSLWLEISQLFIGVNCGVLLGSLPIYIALKKPIGLVLN